MPQPGGTFHQDENGPALSVIIPFFNEAPNVAGVLGELREVITRLAIPCEVLAVNDGSTDTTAAELDSARAAWPDVRVVQFRENRGQAAALWQGFKHARGTWIAMLDGDGQNPPSELAKLWAVRNSADMIAGARVRRKDSILRRAMSRLANRVRGALLRDNVTDTGCSLKVIRREVISSFMPIRTMYSFLPAFAVADGWTVLEVGVAHHPRRAGVSKYGLRAMAIHPFLDLVALCWLLRRRVRRKPDDVV